MTNLRALAREEAKEIADGEIDDHEREVARIEAAILRGMRAAIVDFKERYYATQASISVQETAHTALAELDAPTEEK